MIELAAAIIAVLRWHEMHGPVIKVIVRIHAAVRSKCRVLANELYDHALSRFGWKLFEFTCRD